MTGAATSLLSTALIAQGNDSCASSQTIAGSGVFPFDTSSATTDGLADALCEDFGTDQITNDVWFRWTAPTSESYTIQTCNGTGVDTRIAVYGSTACPTGSPITCVDDSCSTQTSVSFLASAGTTYLIRLGCFPSAPGGTGTFDIGAGGSSGCDSPASGPDVIVGDLNGLANFGASGSLAGYAIGTTSCNIGDAELQWQASNPNHPVIGQNIYRLEDGRFEQLGLSWLKHGFTALQEDLCCDCQSSGTGTRLGVGCSDPYGAGLNGSQGGLGPRFEVNAATGAFTYPYTAQGQQGNNVYKRIRVAHADLDPALHPTAEFFGEGQYITPDDSAAGNDNNNCSYRAIDVGGQSGGAWTLSLTGITHRGDPAIQAWQDRIPAVQLENVQVPSDGLFILGSNTADNGDGTWRYEYAVFNMNSDRSGQHFSVPVAPGVSVTGVGFHDVIYHSGEPYDGTDWSSSQGGGLLTWETATFATNPNANALRWGTLYNFWFDANVSPIAGQVTLGLFKPGTPTSMVIDASVPSGDTLPFNYCQTSANSAGPGAVMGFGGNTSLAANNFVLDTTGAIPNGFGLFYYGPQQIQAPFGNGFRCVGASGGGTHRLFPPQQADGGGSVSRPLDFTVPPAASGSGAILAGSTWNFQYWFRDGAGGGAQFNLSDGLSASFVP